jgi:hypothetical protein
VLEAGGAGDVELACRPQHKRIPIAAGPDRKRPVPSPRNQSAALRSFASQRGLTTQSTIPKYPGWRPAPRGAHLDCGQAHSAGISSPWRTPRPSGWPIRTKRG